VGAGKVRAEDAMYVHPSFAASSILAVQMSESLYSAPYNLLAQHPVLHWFFLGCSGCVLMRAQSTPACPTWPAGLQP
jgi:hypothetical protein